MNIKKDIKFFLVLIIAVTVIILISLYKLNISDKLYNYGNKVDESKLTEYATIENISENEEFNQKFVAKENNLEIIYLQFNPFKEQANIDGNVVIGLKDENGNIIKENNIKYNDIRENSNYKFKFDIQRDSKDKEYSLYVKFIDKMENNNFYSIRYDNKISNGDLTINGNNVEGILCYEDLYKDEGKAFIYNAFLIAIILIVLISSIIIYYSKNINVEKAFLYTVPAICIIFLIAMPIFKNHDEIWHWYRAYEVSEGALISGIKGTTMPEAVYSVMPLEEWEGIKYSTLKEKSNIVLDETKEAFISAGTASVYSPIQYIPQTIGILLGKIFTDSILSIGYMARIFNMIIAILFTFLAIKIIPFGKKIILLIMYIPIIIEGFTSLSPDAMTISVSFLFIAYVFNLRFNPDIKQINLKHKIILAILSIIIALCKIVYIPLVGLLMLLPKEKFKSTKQKWINVVLIGGVALIINLIWLKISAAYLTDFRGGDSKFQVLNILMNPINYMQMLLYSIDLNGNSYILSMFGSNLGWGELVNLNSIIPYALFILLIGITIIENDIKDKFNIFDKTIIILIILAIGGLIFTSLYVQWTTVGSTSIQGVQGRYLLPILPLIAILIGSCVKVKNNYKEENIIKTIAITGMVLQIGVILSIVNIHL